MSRVIGIVTVYYPEQKQIEQLKKISEQVDTLLICNNTPDYKMPFIGGKCEVFDFGENRGLSEAFNYAINNVALVLSDDDYIVFFDQDSRIDERYIERLVDTYEKIETRGYRIGMLGPVYRDKKNGKVNIPNQIKSTDVLHTFETQSIITSSMLVKYGVLKKVGFWNEDIFLDMADFDLCWRMTNCGYIIYINTDLILEHSVGEKVVSFAGKQLQIWNPIRNYYRIRDGLKLYHAGYMPENERRRFRITFSVEQVINVFVADRKRERIAYYFRAIRDYRNDIKGSYEQNSKKNKKV